METGYIVLPKLTKKLKDIEDVFFRMVLRIKEGQWFLYSLVVDVLPEGLKEDYPIYDYSYGQVAFIAGRTGGKVIREWLLRKKGEVNEYTFRIVDKWEAFNRTLSWTRYPSHAPTRFVNVPYPVTIYESALTSAQQPLPMGFLVGNKCPFFPDFRAAVSQLIYGITDALQIRDPQEAIIFRFIHDEAYLEHIEVLPTLLSITVAGSHLLNTQLQIKGSLELLRYKTITQAGLIDCPLPNGLPPDVWIVLSRGNKWLDYCYLSQRWSPFKQAPGNVTISSPDIHTRIQEHIAQGEGPKVEFKVAIPDRIERLLRTVAAFANGEGGVILLGIEDGTGDIVGIVGDVNRENDRITNSIRNNVVPEPQIRIEQSDLNGKNVVAIYVDKGIFPPYGIYPAKPEFYVRRGATTFPARHEEIVTLAQPKQPGKWYQS